MQTKPPHKTTGARATTRTEPHDHEKAIGQLALDIYRTDNEIVILAPIAGISPEDVTVNMEEEVLTIKGIRKLHERVPEETYLTKECFWGDFSRSIVLPNNTDTDKINASFKNGILRIAIPIIEKSSHKIIRVKS